MEFVDIGGCVSDFEDVALAEWLVMIELIELLLCDVVGDVCLTLDDKGWLVFSVGDDVGFTVPTVVDYLSGDSISLFAKDVTHSSFQM